MTLDLNCDNTSSVNVSRFYFVSSLPQTERFYSIDSVCLSREVSYRLTTEDTSFVSTGWLIDSVIDIQHHIDAYKFTCALIF